MFLNWVGSWDLSTCTAFNLSARYFSPRCGLMSAAARWNPENVSPFGGPMNVRWTLRNRCPLWTLFRLLFSLVQNKRGVKDVFPLCWLCQESYVWKMYQERCWEFFPVGDCFRKQYEDQLGWQETSLPSMMSSHRGHLYWSPWTLLSTLNFMCLHCIDFELWSECTYLTFMHTVSLIKHLGTGGWRPLVYDPMQS